MFIISATKCDEPLVRTEAPLVYELFSQPTPIPYDLKHCVVCLKVDEMDITSNGVTKGMHVCQSCAKRKLSTSAVPTNDADQS